ncbi:MULTISPECIES: hypothetical protein [Caballeronia]|uniref:hypothetical protein n=1 Tax=Caballeronia TaxID=1827195 RepID=UPI00158B60A1|nr:MULTISPECIES: hypothetical protein [Caballeronia]MCG7404347.1 hypothetical protein [Caballeronia zhejiangensis]MCI1045887.1 hypothetical protein [Caballeronia zhejiangensis]
MKRVFLIVVLLIGSSSLFAAERYTEVWNPPEAQSVKGKSKTHAAPQTAAKKKHKGATSVKQVADKAAIEQAPVTPRSKASSPKQSEPVIPRKIEPNGQVMRV